MYSEANRRETFTSWPHSGYRWAQPDPMAQAGFYHQVCVITMAIIFLKIDSPLNFALSFSSQVRFAFCVVCFMFGFSFHCLNVFS